MITFAKHRVFMGKTSNQISDRELMEGIRHSRRETLEYMYNEYYPMVYKMVITNQGNKEDARDLFQEGMLVVIEKAQSPDFYLSSKMGTFLYSVCRRLWLNKINRQKNRENLHAEVPDIEIELPRINDEQSEEEQLVTHLFRRLSESCREILRMRFFEKLKDKEIARQMSLSGADYVKTQRHRCMKQLKKIYHESTK